jgi:hypothetical protein
VGSLAEVARVTAGPPNIPKARAETLYTAYRKAIEDPRVIAAVEKSDRPLEPLYGEELGQLMRAALDQPPSVVAMLREILEAGDKAKK